MPGRLLAGNAVERTDTAKQATGAIPSMSGGTQQLVAANAARAALYVSNTSAANKMWLGLGTTAAANAGIMIPPNTTFGPLTAFTGVVNIIGTAADTVAFCEI
jgi:hypothetical protein